MERIIITFAFACIVCATPSFAQSDVPAYKRNYVNDKSETVENVRNKLNNASGGTQSSNSKDEDLVKVNGDYYMPLYSVNLYKGDDGKGFREQCLRLFKAYYKDAKVTSVALPQTAWLTAAAVKNGKTIGYTQTMYCYIIAEDGHGSYINARFAYKRYKDAGGKYAFLSDYSPKWERTDEHISASVYSKLLKK